MEVHLIKTVPIEQSPTLEFCGGENCGNCEPSCETCCETFTSDDRQPTEPITTIGEMVGVV